MNNKIFYFQQNNNTASLTEILITEHLMGNSTPFKEHVNIILRKNQITLSRFKLEIVKDILADFHGLKLYF